MFTRISLLSSVLSMLLMGTASAYNQQVFDGDSPSATMTQKELDLLRPRITFPSQFVISMSTNDPGLNLTEVTYYDSVTKKVRIQFYYSILGLEPTKGFDITLDEQNEMVAVQSDRDCKKNYFGHSLFPVQLFFSMFDALTLYRGIEDGMHKFKVRQFDENNQGAPRFHFYFDENLVFKKASIFQADVGSFDFIAVIPFSPRTFETKDWYMFECDQIQEEILQEHNNFVSFTQQLVKHLLGEEDEMLASIGYDKNKVDIAEWIKEGADKARLATSDKDEDYDFED